MGPMILLFCDGSAEAQEVVKLVAARAVQVRQNLIVMSSPDFFYILWSANLAYGKILVCGDVNVPDSILNMFCESVWADSVFPIITDPMGSSKTFAFMEKRGIRWPSNIAANMRHDRVAELIAEILPLQTGR